MVRAARVAGGVTTPPCSRARRPRWVSPSTVTWCQAAYAGVVHRVGTKTSGRKDQCVLGDVTGFGSVGVLESLSAPAGGRCRGGTLGALGGSSCSGADAETACGVRSAVCGAVAECGRGRA